MPPKTPEQKAAMMARLKAGKEAKAKARADAKEKGLPDPHPRKPRAKKALAIQQPLAAAPANDTVRGIDEATKDGVAKKPVEMNPSETKPIDVPGLPGDAEATARKKGIVKDAEKKPVPKEGKGLSTTGKPKKVNAVELITNQETGSQVVSAMFPGQEESIKKALKANKKTVTTAAGAVKQEHPNAIHDSKTVHNVKEHIPDMKSIQGGKAFSFSAVKKLLYQ
jgi:hypothetical protein